MTATPADIARFTNDGVTLTAADESLRDLHPDAVDETDVLETHFDTVPAGQFVLQERFALLSIAGRLHDAVELDAAALFGIAIPVAPRLPAYRVIDESRALNERVIVRSYGFDHEIDRYPIELVGAPPPSPSETVTYDSTVVTVDDTSYTHDET